MTLSGLLAEFGIDSPCAVEREFVTPLGAPKSIVRVEATGERLFVGSLIHSWPTLAQINAVFPAQSGQRWTAASEFNGAGGPFRSQLGTWYAQALRCILTLERERVAIRSVADSFREREPAAVS